MKSILIAIIIGAVTGSLDAAKQMPERCLMDGFSKGQATFSLFIMPYKKLNYWVPKTDKNGNHIKCVPQD